MPMQRHIADFETLSPETLAARRDIPPGIDEIELIGGPEDG